MSYNIFKEKGVIIVSSKYDKILNNNININKNIEKNDIYINNEYNNYFIINKITPKDIDFSSVTNFSDLFFYRTVVPVSKSIKSV